MQTEINTVFLNTLLANVEFSIGRFFSKERDFQTAILHYRRAIRIDSRNLMYHAEYQQIYFIYNKIDKEEMKKALNLQAVTQSDYYYAGLLRYLSKDYEKANLFYRKSSKADWKYYDILLS